MSVNIYKDKLQNVWLFGQSVLYTELPIPRDLAEKNHADSVLSFLPLKNGRSQSRLVKDMFQLDAASVTLSKFCSDEKISCPKTPIRHLPRPASPEEAGLFLCPVPGGKRGTGAIGHVRIDFGRSGSGFHLDWFPKGPEELKTPEFKSELQEVVNDLRKSVLKGLGSMHGYCHRHAGEIDGGTCCQNYGYVVETNRYLYRLRCNPAQGDYQAYLSCFDKQVQTQGLTPKGRQVLKNAAGPGKARICSWYVMEQINNPDLRTGRSGPLEEMIQAYARLGGADKRLGVTKDSIAAVDLVICLNSREWLSNDWTKLDSFQDDPMVAAAVSALQTELGAKPLFGRVSFASGERIGYTDPEEYIQTVQEELRVQPPAFATRR